MKSLNVSKVLPLAAAVALTVGMTGTARADAYADAYLNITNLVVTADPNALTFITQSNVDNSSATACLPAAPNCVSTGGSNTTASGAAQIGINLPNQTWTQAGATGTYARADAIIDSQQLVNGTPTQTHSIAEGNVPVGTANANSSNSSGTNFTVQFQLQQTSAINFAFDATAFMQAMLTPGSLNGSQAKAQLTANISILDVSGNAIFNWNPDGTNSVNSGSISGDPFSLNRSLTALPLTPGPLTYTQSCIGGVGNQCFNGTTGLLGVGTYTLQFSEVTSINLNSINPIPEPGSLALVGLALVGLGVAGRRRAR